MNFFKKLFSIPKALLFFFMCTQSSLFPANELVQKQHDDFIQNFVKQEKNDRVLYQSGKLILLVPSPSNETVLGKGMITLLLGSAGTFSVYMGAAENGIQGNDQEFKKTLAILSGIFMLGCGGYCGYDLASQLTKASNNSVYLEFDNKGLSCEGRRVLRWAEIDKIEIVKKAVSTNNKTYKFRCAEFRDRYAKCLFSLEEYSELLPIRFDTFVAIAQHFIDTYGLVN